MPPASATATARLGEETVPIGACWIGATHPTRSVSRVRIMLIVPPNRQFIVDGIWCRRVRSYRETTGRESRARGRHANWGRVTLRLLIHRSHGAVGWAEDVFYVLCLRRQWGSGESPSGSGRRRRGPYPRRGGGLHDSWLRRSSRWRRRSAARRWRRTGWLRASSRTCDPRRTAIDLPMQLCNPDV